MAEEAMRTVVKSLKQTLDNPQNVELRSAMAWASTQAGLCVLAGDTGESALHVFCLPVSALFDVAHGEALALVMPFVLPELAKIRPQKVARLLNMFVDDPGTVKNLSTQAACDLTLQKMDLWLEDIGLKLRFSEYGIQDSDMSALTQSINFTRLTNAWERSITHEEVEELYRQNL
jgi:alcohol dehydrogenase YqhD (iron-dependent ADH family)